MMSEDGFERLSREEFWALVAKQKDETLEERLLVAQSHGLASNLRRQLAFVGANEQVFEFQALGVKRYPNDSFDRSKAAHARGPEEAIALCTEADTWLAHGIYLLPARLRSGVESRNSSPGRWFEAPKGQSTTDSDIEARLVLPVDFDVKRPSGISATEEEMQKSVRIALNAYSYLANHLGDNSLAYLHSGNGRQIHIALDSIAANDESKYACAGLLTGLAHLFNSSEVQVDEKLFDAKRILPACGTIKKKGAPGVIERPHRQTAIVTPESPTRVSLDQIKELARHLWEEATAEGRIAIEKSFGVKPQTENIVTGIRDNPNSPYGLANAVDPQQVADWLGVYNQRGEVVCPGCGETSGVAVLNRGLKCHHNRCKDKGRNGFRTNIDLVAEIHRVTAKEAVVEISNRFNLNLSQPTADPPSPQQPTGPFSLPPRFKKIPTAEIFEKLNDIQWLVKEMHLVAGRPTLIAGYGFSGKTLIAQSMALGLASATPVWGKFLPATAVNVWHLDYEQGSYATKRRYQRLAYGHGISRDALADRLEVTVFPDVYLDSPDAVDAYSRAVEHISVVFLDALRGATPTMDENDSTIRRCLDNLSRISEKTGTAFVVLHHAGKTRDSDNSDQRKIPRGSSAIFDACGCVLAIEGDKNEPKLVCQTKAPAEAEGSALEDFYVAIEDVAGPSGPSEGLRVFYSEGTQTRVQIAINKDSALRERIVEAVRAYPGQFKSANAIARAVGGRKTETLNLVRDLVDEGVILHPDCKGGAFGLGTAGTGSHDPKAVGTTQGTAADQAVPGTSPLRAGTARARGGENGRSVPDRSEQRAKMAEQDADMLELEDPKQWTSLCAKGGWGSDREKRARAIAKARLDRARFDGRDLSGAQARGEDPRAWATEQGWPDERTSKAMRFLDTTAPPSPEPTRPSEP